MKSSFPPSFTVEEAFYAAALELIKVLILTMPVPVVIGIALFRTGRNERHD